VHSGPVSSSLEEEKGGGWAHVDPSLLGYITWQQVRLHISLKVIPFFSPLLPFLKVHASYMLSGGSLSKGSPKVFPSFKKTRGRKPTLAVHISLISCKVNTTKCPSVYLNRCSAGNCHLKSWQRQYESTYMKLIAPLQPPPAAGLSAPSILLPALQPNLMAVSYIFPSINFIPALSV